MIDLKNSRELIAEHQRYENDFLKDFSIFFFFLWRVRQRRKEKRQFKCFFNIHMKSEFLWFGHGGKRAENYNFKTDVIIHDSQ